MSSVFQDYALLYFTESESLAESRAHHLVSLTVEHALEISYLLLSVGISKMADMCADFYVDAGILNSSPHTQITIVAEK